MKKTVRSSIVALTAALVLSVAGHVRAEDKPMILDANNWQEGKDLLPDPVLKRLQAGEYWFKVVPVDPAEFKKNYAQKFWDATAANEGKYDLDPNTSGLKDKATGKIPDFLIGFPFPNIDKND